MTKLKKLKCQFEKEDAYWQSEMKSYNDCIKAAMICAEMFETDIQKWKTAIDIAADYKYRMMKLDTKHKKFLLRWQRRFNKALLVHNLREKLGV